MRWLPWHRRRHRGQHWHDLTQPEPTTDAGKLAADMRDEIQRLADISNEPVLLASGVKASGETRM